MSDRLQELNRLIAEERAGYTELITLLEQEQRELISGSAHKLEALAQQKAIVLQELDALAQQRGDHMRVLGMVSLNAWRAWLADKPELLPAWLGLEVLAQKAKLINEINGKLILTHMEHVEASLEVLFTSDQSTFAYSRDGGARSALIGGRRLGSA
jgi:flagella synthesis protein FlgN